MPLVLLLLYLVLNMFRTLIVHPQELETNSLSYFMCCIWFEVCCYVAVWLRWCGIRMQAEALKHRNITSARNKAPWWWSDNIETSRSVLKCFKSVLCENLQIGRRQEFYNTLVTNSIGRMALSVSVSVTVSVIINVIVSISVSVSIS